MILVSPEGSVTPTAEKLRLSQPAISMQLRELERSLGAKLLQRSGRSLALTEAGRHRQRYADPIFDLGRELTDSLAGRESRFARFTVGVGGRPPERLLTELAAQTIDPALADTPLTPPTKTRACRRFASAFTPSPGSGASPIRQCVCWPRPRVPSCSAEAGLPPPLGGDQTGCPSGGAPAAARVGLLEATRPLAWRAAMRGS